MATLRKPLLYLRFFVQGVLPVPPAVLGKLQLALSILAILCRGVVPPIALAALQGDKLLILRFTFGHRDLPGVSAATAHASSRAIFVALVWSANLYNVPHLCQVVREQVVVRTRAVPSCAQACFEPSTGFEPVTPSLPRTCSTN